MSGNVRQIGQRNGIPSFDASSVSFDGTACLRAFRDFQIIHLRNAAATFNDTKKKRNVLKWQDIYKLYSDLNDEDKASWCVETKGAAATSEFLSSSSTDERAYCSFLIQKDKDILRKTIGRLPISHFPWNETSEWAYEDALWLFFGRNQLGNINLDGRPEHTDSVSHDGTWHYQLSGTKRWFLRPTEELEASLANKSRLVPKDQTLHIDCKEGDILIINTRLWFHRTMIPPQRKPSISYARDFRLKNDDPNIAIANGMTNLDGMYATTAIDTDTIIFREEDMPDCELCTSTNPNCEVVELDDGTCAVVSTRTIAAGEFFCVKEDSSDESGDD